MQLRMIRKNHTGKHYDMPEGYHLRTYKDASDKATWLSISKNGILAETDGEAFFDAYVDNGHMKLEEDMFFVVREADNKEVATISTYFYPATDDQPILGEVGWVTALPETRGLGIGKAMTTFAAERLEEKACAYEYLNTDDFRLAAIKAYLDNGFVPVNNDTDMCDRWAKIFETLHVAPMEVRTKEEIVADL